MSGRTGRRRGGPDTRGRILDAARRLFAERGYERTTIRAVAAEAGVDPALLHHYFGTKAGLFAAAGELPFDPGALLAGLAEHPERAGGEVARLVLGMYEENPEARATLLGLLRAAVSQPEAADAARELFGRALEPHLQRIVDDQSAQLRASLMASQIAGLAIARFILRLPGVAEVPVDELARAVGPALQHYVTGDLGIDARR